MSRYCPPLSITPEILALVGQIGETLGRWSATAGRDLSPRLRRGNRIRTIQASLAIENNSLTVDQVSAILDGKRVLGLPREIQEVRNALAAYYGALAASDRAADSTPFVTFMLQTLLAAMEEAVEVTDPDEQPGHPVGDRLSDQVTDQVSDRVSDPAADQVGDRPCDPARARIAQLLAVFGGNESLTIAEIMQRLGLRHRPTVRKNYLHPALAAGRIIMTQPDAPSSPTQRYRPSPKARPS